MRTKEQLMRRSSNLIDRWRQGTRFHRVLWLFLAPSLKLSCCDHRGYLFFVGRPERGLSPRTTFQAKASALPPRIVTSVVR